MNKKKALDNLKEYIDIYNTYGEDITGLQCDICPFSEKNFSKWGNENLAMAIKDEEGLLPCGARIEAVLRELGKGETVIYKLLRCKGGFYVKAIKESVILSQDKTMEIE